MRRTLLVILTAIALPLAAASQPLPRSPGNVGQAAGIACDPTQSSIPDTEDDLQKCINHVADRALEDWTSTCGPGETAVADGLGGTDCGSAGGTGQDFLKGRGPVLIDPRSGGTARLPGLMHDPAGSYLLVSGALAGDPSAYITQSDAGTTEIALRGGQTASALASTLTDAFTDAADTSFCRDQSDPFVGTCSSGADCVTVTSGEQHPDPLIFYDASEGNYHLLAATDYTGCNSATNTLSLSRHMPVALDEAGGDRFYHWPRDTVHWTDAAYGWLAQQVTEATYAEHYYKDSANLWANGRFEEGCGDWTASAGTLSALSYTPTDARPTRSSFRGAGCVLDNGSGSAADLDGPLLSLTAGSWYVLRIAFATDNRGGASVSLGMEDSGGSAFDYTDNDSHRWSVFQDGLRVISFAGSGNDDLCLTGSLDSDCSVKQTDDWFYGWTVVTLLFEVPAGVSQGRLSIKDVPDGTRVAVDEAAVFPHTRNHNEHDRIFAAANTVWAVESDSRLTVESPGLDGELYSRLNPAPAQGVEEVVIESGESGDKLRARLNLLTDRQPFRAFLGGIDRGLLYIGVNDLSISTSGAASKPSEYLEDVREYYSRARAAAVPVVHLLYAPYYGDSSFSAASPDCRDDGGSTYNCARLIDDVSVQLFGTDAWTHQ